MLQKSSGKLHHTTTSANRETQSIFFFFQMCQGCSRIQHFLLLLKLKKTDTLLSDIAIIFLALYNNFFYTHLAFVLHLQKYF